MCTRVLWPDANGAVIVGRNMDFHTEGSKVLKLDLVGRLALEGGLSGDVSHKFEAVDDLGMGLVQTGIEALEYVAKKQDEFKRLATTPGLLGLGKGSTQPA